MFFNDIHPRYREHNGFADANFKKFRKEKTEMTIELSYKFVVPLRNCVIGLSLIYSMIISKYCIEHRSEH